MKKALIVRGGWEGHQPIETSELFIPFLEGAGFDVQIESSTAIYADAAYLSTIDLIIQVITFGTLRDEEAQGLITAVSNGTGFMGWHGGVLASFGGMEKYLHMVGAIFVNHPGKPESERTGASSDWFVPHTYNFTKSGKTHEITRGVEDFELVTEQYWVLHDPYLDVLATTTQAVRVGDPWHREVTSPAIWTRLWGKGKLFVITIGHDVETIQHESVKKIIERGTLWAIR